MIETPDRPKYPHLRKAANAVTEIRLWGSYAVATETALRGPSFRSWGLAGGAVLCMAMDNFDGWLARKSNISDEEAAKKDEGNDKRAYRAHMASLAVATGDTRYLAYSAANDVRNGLTDRWRDRLRDRNLSADARQIGKYKTLVQNVGIAVDLSPIGDSVPEIVHKIHQFAVGMTAVSGYDIVMDAQKQLAASESVLLLPDAEEAIVA